MDATGRKEIYEMRAKYGDGARIQLWCYTAQKRDQWLDAAHHHGDHHGGLVEIQQCTYVLKGEKIEYFRPETEK
jgi:ribonuclease BN (tRNA processing enzyme)